MGFDDIALTPQEVKFYLLHQKYWLNRFNFRKVIGISLTSTAHFDPKETANGKQLSTQQNNIGRRNF
ncbi:hypothetical protein ACROYT_G005960 [Oculina patagonica]